MSKVIQKPNMKRTAASNQAQCLFGWEQISEYLQMTPATLRRWRRDFDLPVLSLPDGGVVTSVRLIDDWIFLNCTHRHPQMRRKRCGPQSRVDKTLN